MKTLFLSTLLFGSLVSLPSLLDGCPTDDDDDTPDPCGEGTIEIDGLCVADLPPGWTQVVPGAPTLCARGGEFSYFVRPGTVNKLVVGFDGGGACWDALTCSKANPTFTDSVTEDDNPNTMTDGVFDDTNPDNPFKDWFAIFIPYCTGDIHWGDATTHYEASNGFPPVTIQHRGYINGTTALDWVYDHFEAPERIFVTGVSAGSYGTMLYTPYLQEHYADSEVVQLGDSGAGVITQEWLEQSFASWNAQTNFPAWIPEIQQADITTLTMNDIYIQVGRYYPQTVLSQFNTASDDVQEFYFEAMGGNTSDWGTGLDANIAACSENTPGFRYYTSWGSSHGIIPYDEMYTTQVNGVRFRDWLAGLADGGEVQDVHCTDCSTPEYYQP